jgi:hypothetical protein
MPADEPGPQDGPKFRSPKRSLALAFRLSRDRWKQKATRRLQEIKAFRVKVRDLQVSRDLWKEKALHLQRQLQQAPGQLQQAQGLAPQHQEGLGAADPLPPPACPPGPPEEPQAQEGPAPKKARRARR